MGASGPSAASCGRLPSKRRLGLATGWPCNQPSCPEAHLKFNRARYQGPLDVTFVIWLPNLKKLKNINVSRLNALAGQLKCVLALL
jgi:hypothetical protein